jgi:hypothetical protein
MAEPLQFQCKEVGCKSTSKSAKRFVEHTKNHLGSAKAARKVCDRITKAFTKKVGEAVWWKVVKPRVTWNVEHLTAKELKEREEAEAVAKSLRVEEAVAAAHAPVAESVPPTPPTVVKDSVKDKDEGETAMDTASPCPGESVKETATVALPPVPSMAQLMPPPAAVGGRPWARREPAGRGKAGAKAQAASATQSSPPLEGAGGQVAARAGQKRANTDTPLGGYSIPKRPRSSEVWDDSLKGVAGNQHPLCPKARASVLKGLSATRTTMNIVASDVGEFEVTRRRAGWAKTDVAKDLDVLRESFNTARDELDTAARALAGYQRSLGAAAGRGPSMTLVDTYRLSQWRMAEGLLAASQSTVSRRDKDIERLKEEWRVSEAALLVSKADLAKARSSLLVAQGGGSGSAAASVPPASVAEAPAALVPSVAGVVAGVNPLSDALMVRSGVTTTECIRARTALLAEWEYWSHFSN